jgi:hypothetical protein
MIKKQGILAVIYFIQVLILIYILLSPAYAVGEAPPKVGNFINVNVPTNLVSFGQFIVSQGTTQIYFYADDFEGKNKRISNLNPRLNYGMTDDLSVSLGLPVAMNFKDGTNNSYGLEDVNAQLEYAFYRDSTSSYVDLFTFVTNVSFPTGSVEKTPNTGIGANSFLVGATFNRTTTDWWGFIQPGVILTNTHHGLKYGNQTLYDAGIGRCLTTFGKEWLLAFLVEFDGIYTEKTKLMRVKDPDSGGNFAFVTPSFYLSSNNLMLQFGVGIPVIQRLNGTQKKIDYVLEGDLAWTF